MKKLSDIRRSLGDMPVANPEPIVIRLLQHKPN
jgi:hypothetical protein